MTFARLTVAAGLSTVPLAAYRPSRATFALMLAGVVVALCGVSALYTIREPVASGQRDTTVDVVVYAHTATGRWHRSARCAGYGETENVEAVPVGRVPEGMEACGNCADDGLVEIVSRARE